MPRKSVKSQQSQTDQTVALPAHGWKCRPYQVNLWNYITGGGKLATVAWHRRAGKDLFAVNLIAYLTTRRQGLYWHVFPLLNQGRRVIWEGYTGDGKRFLDYLPGELRNDVNQHEMRVNLKTGSTYQIVGGDNADKLVGSNPIGVVFSEYALMDPAIFRYIRPILAENGGWALFISTPRGHNHYYTLFQAAEKNPDWFAERLTIENTKAIDIKELDNDRSSGMSENLIRQEYYCEWEAPIEGAYYADAMKRAEQDNRIADVPMDDHMDVWTAWDLGMRDTTVILFYQIEPRTKNIRIFDVYSGSGEGIPHYANKLRSKGYSFAGHIAPWDIQIREIGTGKSRIEIARQYGIKFSMAPRLGVDDGIEACRELFPQVWIDRTQCDKLIEALKTYRKEWDLDKQIYKPKPTHDWSSHWADAFRYLCTATRFKPTRASKDYTSKPDQYDTFAPAREFQGLLI
jgi:hypothetical protein